MPFYLILYNWLMGIILSVKYKFWITKLEPIYHFFFCQHMFSPYKSNFLRSIMFSSVYVGTHNAVPLVSNITILIIWWGGGDYMPFWKCCLQWVHCYAPDSGWINTGNVWKGYWHGKPEVIGENSAQFAIFHTINPTLTAVKLNLGVWSDERIILMDSRKEWNNNINFSAYLKKMTSYSDCCCRCNVLHLKEQYVAESSRKPDLVFNIIFYKMYVTKIWQFQIIPTF
jgi:hypothetical protein